MSPEDASAWLPVLRDYLALFTGGALGTLGLVEHDPWLAAAGFVLAGVVVDSKASLLHRLGAWIVVRYRARRARGRNPKP